jgi:hypothetical protein
MAMDSLASAAHAAGFAMVPEDEIAAITTAGFTHKIVADRSISRSLDADTSARWQGSAKPVTEVADRATTIFDWMPSFSWRADGR